MTTWQQRARPSLGEIFITWLTTGVQSFGGGSSTFYLLHQAITGKGWMDEETFVRTWALAQISPGINLLKLTVLVGYYLRGWPGLLAGMAGLLIPSASVTVLMTAGFALVRSQPLVQSALRGILPATIGLSLAMAIQMGQPLLTRAHREGPARLWLQIALIAVAGLLLALWSVSPLFILVGSGAATILLHMWVPARAGSALPPAAGAPQHKTTQPANVDDAPPGAPPGSSPGASSGGAAADPKGGPA